MLVSCTFYSPTQILPHTHIHPPPHTHLQSEDFPHPLSFKYRVILELHAVHSSVHYSCRCVLEMTAMLMSCWGNRQGERILYSSHTRTCKERWNTHTPSRQPGSVLFQEGNRGQVQVLTSCLARNMGRREILSAGCHIGVLCGGNLLGTCKLHVERPRNPPES